MTNFLKIAPNFRKKLRPIILTPFSPPSAELKCKLEIGAYHQLNKLMKRRTDIEPNCTASDKDKVCIIGRCDSKPIENIFWVFINVINGRKHDQDS